MAGLHMEMQDPVEPGASLQLVSYCPRHCKPNPELSGRQGGLAASPQYNVMLDTAVACMLVPISWFMFYVMLLRLD